MRRTDIRHAVGAATVTLVALSGCSDDARAAIASVIVCERAEDLQEALDEVAEEVADNDLADARDEISDMRRDFTSLSSRIDSVSSGDRDAIRALLPDADAAITGLESATGTDGISAALDEERVAVEALASMVDSALDCDD